jgi:CTP synthase (UTP-ammonia lyase)
MTPEPWSLVPTPPRLALVGDRSPDVQAHVRLPGIIDFVNAAAHDPIEVYWLHSTSIAGPADVDGFDGIWVVPGSPYQNPAGVLAAVQGARQTGTPFLGTCGGFQYMLIEYARNVCGLGQAAHGEIDPEAAEPLVVPLACSLLGQEAAVTVLPGTKAAQAMGAGRATERFFCRYGLNDAYQELLVSHGLVFSGSDELGNPRLAELAGHPFFVGSLFQPELSSGPGWAHPLIVAFTTALRQHAATSTSARAASGVVATVAGARS